ncbi:hypothetical protein DAERI_060152 [Deinococcus aerius]|uniref:Tfp pilus assembly protein PilX n=1 Tax=Deinococcus aerius TaxID=200253 RepID=A0A2I9CVF6_9DEIO|nr:hypothetical protein [Deinococcus aerius]GBF05892.1 hypothetical protein DAERI_060152 [Deinococcus aerius]
MIVVVLFTLLLLAGILAATMRLGLGSRQNTVDQAAILKAQYAAESNVTLLRSKLRDYQDILSSNGINASGVQVPYLLLPAGTSADVVKNDAKAFCGKGSVADPWVPTSDFATAREAGDAELFPSATQCVATSAPTLDSYGILADAVTSAAYNELPPSERPAAGSTRAALLSWWQNQLSNVSSGNIKYDIRPLRVVKLTDNRYRFYLGVTNLDVKGSSGTGQRYMAGTRSDKGDWWFEIKVPNPFDNVLFINNWPSADGGFYNDVIDGDFFTNQKVRMLFGINSVNFRGKLRSAGCTAFPGAGTLQNADCTKGDGPGFYGGLNTLISPDAGITDNAAKSANLKSKMTNQGTNFTSTVAGDFSFTEKYIPLPLTANTQAADAANGGLTLAPNESGVELVAGDASGNPLNNYDSSKSLWKESNPTYQYIRIKGPASSSSYDNSTWIEVDKSDYDNWPADKKKMTNNPTMYWVRPKQVDNSREFRFGPDKILYAKSGSGWVSTGTTFNGVIYGSQNITVSGPMRKDSSLTADVSKMPPALASFAKLNITGGAGLRLDTDLTLSNTPCDNGNTQQGCPKTGDAKPQNALCLFAPAGDVVMTRYTQDEATYHAAIMASNGAFNVENYDKRRVQGSRHVIGSVVENRYGLNGTASLNNGQVTFGSGYGDQFSFDNRLREDILPSSPIVTVWQSADASSTQKRLTNVVWQQSTADNF